MKKVLSIFLVLIATLSALAQGYNRWEIEYGHNFPANNKLAADRDLNIVSAGWVHAFKLGKTTPSYVEMGLQINYGFHNEFAYPPKPVIWIGSSQAPDVTYDDTYPGKRYYNYMGFTVPVRLVIEFPVSRIVTLTPFLEVYARGWAIGRSRWTFKEIYANGNAPQEACRKENVFSDKYTFHGRNQRFNAGAQLGLGAEFCKRYSLRASFGCGFFQDGTEDVPLPLKITAGYKF